MLSIAIKITPPLSPSPRPLAPSYVTLFLTLIRLEAQATDLVITLNVPTILGSPEHLDGSAVRDILAKVVPTFEIKDWDMFSG